MVDEEIAGALFSGEYDHLTVAEFAALFTRAEPPRSVTEEAPQGWHTIEVPVIDGVATFPNGTTVRSRSHVVRLAVLDEAVKG